MKTIKEVVKIIEANEHDWCADQREEALKMLSVVDQNMTIEDFVREKDIPDEWVYTWARYIGDRDIMIERIDDAYYHKKLR